MKKVVLVVIIIFCLAITCNASEPYTEITDSISDELDALKNSLPNEVLDYLPSDIWNGDFSSLLSVDFSEATLLDLLVDFLFLGLKTVVKSFANILVILLIASIFNMLSASMSSDLIKGSFSLCSALCTCFTIFSICTSLTELVSEYIMGLCGAMEAFTPIMATMYIMSGNISSGAVANTSILLFIGLVEHFLVAFMLPIIEISICFSAIKAFGGQLCFDGFSKTIKNTFTGVIVFVMSIFMFVLSTKNILSQSSDSISIKTAKFAISNFIPVVGGTVNDALRTVTSSISYIKNSCGALGIIIIILIILPILIYLLLNKLAFNLSSGIAKAIGCTNEASVLGEGDSICGFLIALVSCTAILFVFAITVFIKTSVLGGI